jgi:hypothetical protein
MDEILLEILFLYAKGVEKEGERQEKGGLCLTGYEWGVAVRGKGNINNATAKRFVRKDSTCRSLSGLLCVL